MPASPGGYVVDPSLLRQAADRGVTICFADLDGADGLWVPEERTVLVNRGLSDDAVAEVIRHELAHVAIDDQHADLDAGRDVLGGHPPPRRTGPWTVVVAAAGLVAVVGGVVLGLAKAGVPGREPLVGPAPTGLLTPSEGGEFPQPDPTVVVTRDSSGRVITVTIVLTPSPLARVTAGSLVPRATATSAAPRTSARPGPTPSVTRSSLPASSSSAPQPAPTPTPKPTGVTSTPVPVPTGTGGGAPIGGGPGGGGPGGGPGGGGPGGGPGGGGPGGGSDGGSPGGTVPGGK